MLSQNSSYATMENQGKIVKQISYFFKILFSSSKIFPHLNLVQIPSRLASLVFFLSVWSCVSFFYSNFMTVPSASQLSLLIYAVSGILNRVVEYCVIDIPLEHAASIFRFEMKRQRQQFRRLDRRYFGPMGGRS